MWLRMARDGAGGALLLLLGADAIPGLPGGSAGFFLALLGGADLGTGGIPDGAAGLDEVDFGGGPDGLGGDLLNLSPFCMILVFFETVFGGTGAFLEAVFALLGGGLPLGRGGLPLGIDGFLVGNSGGGHLGGGGGI